MAMAHHRRETMASRRGIVLSAAFLALAGLAACVSPGARSASGSTAPASDVLGSGGPTDDLYRQIYHPGSGTQF
jgi:hypothetical protein